MPSDNGSKDSPHLAYLCEYATCGRQHIMAFAEQMLTDTDSLPDDLKPYGEAMNKLSMKVLIELYVESLHLISELGLQEIIREEEHRNTIVQRSKSDGI